MLPIVGSNTKQSAISVNIVKVHPCILHCYRSNAITGKICLSVENVRQECACQYRQLGTKLGNIAHCPSGQSRRKKISKTHYSA